MIELDLNTRPGCGPDCPAFLDRWGQFWREQTAPDRAPVAVITCADYMDGLSRNARKIAHRAQRRYTFRRFDFNAHTGDIQAVNVSKEMTTEGPDARLVPPRGTATARTPVVRRASGVVVRRVR